MKIGITNAILIIGIVIYCATIIVYALDRKRREEIEAVRFSAANVKFETSMSRLGELIIRQNEELEKIFIMQEGWLLQLGGQIVAVKNELADYRREFLFTFDSELRNKLTAIIQAGEKPENMIKKTNENGETEWVAVDHGW